MDGVSDPSPHPVRPPHVTVASAIVIVGSAFVVLQMWDRIAGLQSLDTRTTLAAYLADSRLGEAGVDLAQLTDVVRIAAMAAAGCATAMLILGWHVTRRSRSARLALSVLAGALVVTGMVSDWFVESVAATFWAGGIGAAVLTLWLGPAGAWFSDEPAPAPERREAERTTPSSPPPPPTYDASPPPGQPPRQQPPPTQQPWPPTTWTPPPPSSYDVPRVTRARGPRPPALLTACILTWFCTAVGALILVVSVVTLAQDPQSVLDEAYRQNPQLADQEFSRHELLVMLYVVIALVLVGAVVAAGFAVALYRGHRWAWYALLVAAVGSTLFFLVGTLGSPVGLLPAAASAITIFCLLRPDVRAWLASRAGAG
jgi:MFS family permease